MGAIILATCDCGYSSKEMFLGAGMIDHQTRCNFPMYCKNCHSLFEANLYDKKILCTECGTDKVLQYDDKSLYKNGKGGYVFSWSISDVKDAKLLNANYLCPDCGNYNLLFKSCGLFD